MADLNSTNEARRAFLAKCGKFAAVTPPALTLMMTTTLSSGAMASTGCNAGRGNGSEGCDPGNSGNTPAGGIDND